MPSLHPRYPVLKVPAPARLSAAVAQGLIMPEGRPTGDGNIGLHISHTIGGGFRARPVAQGDRARGRGVLTYTKAPVSETRRMPPPIGACAATFANSPISIYVPALHRCAKWPAFARCRRTRLSRWRCRPRASRREAQSFRPRHIYARRARFR